MVPTQSNPSLRAAIAVETITGGGLAHYTKDLDRALRRYAHHDQRIEGKISYPPGTRFPGERFRGLLRRSPVLMQSVRSVRQLLWQASPQANEGLAKRWIKTPADVVAVVPHVPINDEGTLDAYFAAISERPFVWVIHDLHPFHFPDQWRPVDIELMERRFPFLAKHAGHVIVHNDFTAADVCQRLGVDRSRISTVLLPAFFSEAAFSSSSHRDDVCLKRLGITRPYALWASSSTFAHKNHERLLRGWKILSQRGHNLQLVCTGSREPRWNEVSAMIDQLNTGHLTRFTGIINDDDLAAILRNAYMAVCPTIFEGGGPGPAAEACIAAIPLTISDIPQCRQLFNLRSDLCTFFDPYCPQSIADAVEDILQNYESAKIRARFAAAEYSKMRTWQSAAEQYWQAIEIAGRNHR